MGVNFSAINLEITNTGGTELLRTLGSVDAEGQKIRDRIKAALDASNNDLAKIGQVLQKDSVAARETAAAVASIAPAAQQSRIAVEQIDNSVQTMNVRGARATQGIARGFEMVARTGALTGRSLDAVLSNVSQLALGFGPTGLLVGAVGIATAAIVELFERTKSKMEEARKKFEEEIGKMADAGQSSDLQQKARELEFGKPFTTDDDGNTTQHAFSQYAANAYEGSIRDLRAKRNTLEKELQNANQFQSAMIKKQVATLDDQLKPLLEQQKKLNDAIFGVADQPAGMKGLPVTVITAQSDSAAEKEFNKGMARIKQQIDSFGKDLDTAERASLERSVHSQVEAVTQGAEEIHRAIMKQNEESAKAFEAFLKALDRQWNELQNRIRQQAEAMASRISGVMDSVFMAAFAPHGGIKMAFQALTAALLEGLGEMFEKAGEKALLGVALIQKIATAISKFDGPTGIAAGLALVALGAALKGAGARVGSASPGGGGGANYGYSAPLGGTILVNPSGPSSVSSVAGMQARPQINLYATIFGKHDSGAQRELLDMIDLAQRRKT